MSGENLEHQPSVEASQEGFESASTWDELIAAVEKKGGVHGQSGFQPAEEIKDAIERLRALKPEPTGKAFISLTRGEGLRAAARRIAALEQQQEKR